MAQDYQLFSNLLVGAHNGHLAIYELRQNKCQMIPAHAQPVTALAFSPDGKYLVSYSCSENKLSFWQTSTGKILTRYLINQLNLIFTFYF